jgi:hypothetical protein
MKEKKWKICLHKNKDFKQRKLIGRKVTANDNLRINALSKKLMQINTKNTTKDKLAQWIPPYNESMLIKMEKKKKLTGKWTKAITNLQRTK